MGCDLCVKCTSAQKNEINIRAWSVWGCAGRFKQSIYLNHCFKCTNVFIQLDNICTCERLLQVKSLIFCSPLMMYFITSLLLIWSFLIQRLQFAHHRGMCRSLPAPAVKDYKILFGEFLMEWGNWRETRIHMSVAPSKPTWVLTEMRHYTVISFIYAITVRLLQSAAFVKPQQKNLII